MAFHTVQNLAAPADGTRLIVGETYTVSFYNPYSMYVSDWNAAEDNHITLWAQTSQGGSLNLKQQTCVKGNNSFTFNLADYDIGSNVVGLSIILGAYINVNDELYALYLRDPELGYGDFSYGAPIFYGKTGEPSAPIMNNTVSRDAVELSWGAGSAGTNNAVDGYDVQYADSANGAAWSSWTRATGSPASGTSLTVMPPDTVGHYRKFRIRTRGTAGEEWFSEWVESENVLRRKWNAFAGWTDQTLVARGTKIRSVHLTQLQERINEIRTFYGLGHASFSVITPRATRIAWSKHIQEIRTAIDGVSTNHEAWNALYSGKPRIENVTQLRRIIDNM